MDTAPIGVTEQIKADRRGLFTRARYHQSPRADQILEAIREGSISAYSFQGAFKQSQPRVPRGGFRRNGDQLATVRRTESTLREYGPTTFPAYKDAAIVGVRAEQLIALLGTAHPTELARLASMIESGTPLGDPPDPGTPSDEDVDGPAAGDPPDGHSTRSPHEQIRHSYAEFLRRRGAIA
jgi:HK97 family phage prohead protease